MKRAVFIFLSLFLLAGCQEEAPVMYDEYAVISYDIKAPIEFEIKSIPSSDAVDELWYGVYRKTSDGKYIYMDDMSFSVEITDPSSIRVPVSLVSGQEYKIVFVAQHKGAYRIDASGIMTAASPSVGNKLDAFVYVDEIGLIQGDLDKDIVLERRISQINLYTSGVVPQKTKVEISGAPASYDLFAGKASEEKAVMSFDGLEPDGSSTTVGAENYKHVATFFVFSGNRIKCDFTLIYGDGTEKTQTVEGVVTEPNHKTNIVGNI